MVHYGITKVGTMNNKDVVLSISHNDLDGISAQIILNKIYKNLTVINCSYTQTLEILKNYRSEFFKYTKIYITDLVLTTEIYTYLVSLCTSFTKTKFVFVDHHFSSLDIDLLNKPTNLIVLIDINKSTSKILATKFNTCLDESLLTYVEEVNAFDVWDVSSPHFDKGMMYNTIFWVYKPRPFFNMFKQDITLTNNHKQQFDKQYNEMKEYFKLLGDKKLIYTTDSYIVFFGDHFQNWTQLEFPDYLFNIQVFSFGKILIKLHSSLSEEFCSSLTQQLINNLNDEFLMNSGGHNHILSLTHKGDKDYNIIIKYTKTILATIEEYIAKGI